MSVFLNTKNANAVADFTESVLDFLPSSEHALYRDMIKRIHEQEYPAHEELVPAAYKIGRATWPMRRALSLLLASPEGVKIEWTRLLEVCRAKTAAALKKLRASSDGVSIDEALKLTDAAILIDTDMELELSMLRTQIRAKIWEEKKKTITPLLEQSTEELAAIEKRLHQMHEEAARSRTERELLQAKVAAYEDRVYFGGESLPTSMLDTEIQFEREERELPAEE